MRYSVFRQKRKSNRINKYKQIADKYKDVMPITTYLAIVNHQFA